MESRFLLHRENDACLLLWVGALASSNDPELFWKLESYTEDFRCSGPKEIMLDYHSSLPQFLSFSNFDL